MEKHSCVSHYKEKTVEEKLWSIYINGAAYPLKIHLTKTSAKTIPSTLISSDYSIAVSQSLFLHLLRILLKEICSYH